MAHAHADVWGATVKATRDVVGQIDVRAGGIHLVMGDGEAAKLAEQLAALLAESQVTA